MNRNTIPFVSTALAAFVLAACTTSPEEQAAQADAKAEIEAEISARQGESVSRVCARDVDEWEALDDDTVLLQNGDEWLMITLIGTCDPDSALRGIVARTGIGSSCLERGDEIFTAGPRLNERCVVTGLYEWDAEAEPESE
ncbi:MAG: DUF6491 family protein [Pseudomonadota bacterium]